LFPPGYCCNRNRKKTAHRKTRGLNERYEIARRSTVMLRAVTGQEHRIGSGTPPLHRARQDASAAIPAFANEIAAHM